MLQHFSRSQTAKILGITVGRLRYWDQIELVEPSFREKGRVFYDFQDLICLKTAQGLVKKGLCAQRIKQSIDSLRNRIPDFGKQLSNKRVYVFGNRVIVSHKNRLIDSLSGQLFLRFDIDEFTNEVKHQVESFGMARTAEDWFQEGRRYDGDPATYDRAIHCYQQAVRQAAGFTDAYVNMGTVYYNKRKYIDAERCFRMAIEREPYHAKACFNLGNVLDELNCPEEAVQWFERSLEVDPDFADVYYNLAACSEKLGLWDKAVRYWKGYLRFDSESAHGRIAGRHIELLESQVTGRGLGA